MRATLAALLAAVAAIAGCSVDTHGDEGSECRSVVTFRGEVLDGTGLQGLRLGALPPKGRSLRLKAVLCDDRGVETFRTLKGVPPEAALVRDDEIFVGSGFLVATQNHPLHELFAPLVHPDPRPIRGCRPWRSTGRIAEEPSLFKSLEVDPDRGRRRRDVTMHPRMRIDLPEVGGLPRLRRGMRVALRGKRCRSGRAYALSIKHLG